MGKTGNRVMENERIGTDGNPEEAERETPREVCPVCGAELLHELCKVVCRSERCLDRIVYNCAEF